jgi:hypothetical protein
LWIFNIIPTAKQEGPMKNSILTAITFILVACGGGGYDPLPVPTSLSANCITSINGNTATTNCTAAPTG